MSPSRVEPPQALPPLPPLPSSAPSNDLAFLGLELLDRVPVGLALVTARFEVRFLNRGFERTVERTSAFLLVDGVLRLTDPEGEAVLVPALESVLEGVGGTERWLRGKAFGLPNVLCRCSRHPSPTGKEPLAMILLVAMDEEWAPRSDALRVLFGLTPAELRIAEAISSGLTVREIAERYGLAHATVRTHLRSIYAKTGTRRQPELVRVVMASRWLGLV